MPITKINTMNCIVLSMQSNEAKMSNKLIQRILVKKQKNKKQTLAFKETKVSYELLSMIETILSFKSCPCAIMDSEVYFW